jgi:hypothetical protein
MWTRERTPLGAMPAFSSAFGEHPTPCYGAYRASNPTRRQMRFEGLYGEDVCVTSILGGGYSGAARVEAQDSREEESLEWKDRA